MTQLSPPPFKILVSPPLFSVSPLFKVSPTLKQPPPVLICPTNLSWFKQISKGLFYQLNCHFLSKIDFYIIFSIPVQIDYFHLWNLFRFIFKQLRITFFSKIMVAQKIIFLQMCNTIWQIVISKCKNDKALKN